MENLKRTALFDEHVKLGAKIVPFAGWEMPIQYSGIIDEHKTVRDKVGIFDVSHMGQIFISGKDVVSFLQSIVPQNIAKLKDNKAVYCQFTKEDGGMVDDLIVYKLEDEKFLLIVNASRIDEDYNWIVQNKNNYDVNIDNQSDHYSVIALQGKHATDMLNDLGITQNKQPERFSIKEIVILGQHILVARTGYTGEDGFEIIVKNSIAEVAWKELLKIGQKYGIKPIGLGARDTLRLEASMLLYGQDMDETTTPVEASLVWSIPKDKQEDYIGKSVIQKQLSEGTEKQLIAFKMIDKAIPRHNYEIFKDGEKVGDVTSGGVAPSLNVNIGLGYVKSCLKLSTHDTIDIKIRDRFQKAEIVKSPFLKSLK